MTRPIPRLLGCAAAGAGVAAAGYVGLVTGACPIDLGIGRRVRPPGPQLVDSPRAGPPRRGGVRAHRADRWRGHAAGLARRDRRRPVVCGAGVVRAGRAPLGAERRRLLGGGSGRGRTAGVAQPGRRPGQVARRSDLRLKTALPTARPPGIQSSSSSRPETPPAASSRRWTTSARPSLAFAVGVSLRALPRPSSRHSRQRPAH